MIRKMHRKNYNDVFSILDEPRESELSEFPHWVLCIEYDRYENKTIRHICGYAGVPKGRDLDNLRDELRNDPSLGCQDCADRMVLTTITYDKFRGFMKVLKGSYSKGSSNIWEGMKIDI